MLSNMAVSLIMHKHIETTLAKAKALRVYVEPLITKSKNDTTANRRLVFSYLKQKEAITELFREIAPKIAERPGGYTRILKTGFRAGDAADMAYMELVDFCAQNTVEAAAETKKPAKKAATKPAKAADAKGEKKPATRRSRTKKASPKAEAEKAE
jgi:large subunit ribosomal protein L17